MGRPGPAIGVAAVLCLIICGCGGDSPTSATSTTSTTTTTTTTDSTVTAVVEPDPAPTGPATRESFEWETSFTAPLTETTGTGATVTNLRAVLQQAAAGIVIAPPPDLTELYRFDVAATTNRLEGLDSLPIGFRFQYTLPGGERGALVTLTFDLVNDHGLARTISKTVIVQ